MCAWCIQSINWNTKGMIDAISRENAIKPQKQHIWRRGNNKQSIPGVFSCLNVQGKVITEFFRSVKKEGRYSVLKRKNHQQKLQQTAEASYLEENKQQTRHIVKYLEVWKEEKKNN